MVSKRTLLISFIFFYSFLHAENTDSLIQALSNLPDDKSKVKKLNSACSEIEANNTKTALILGNKALELSEKLDYELGIGNSKSSLGRAYAAMNQLDKSIQLHKEALEIFRSLNKLKNISIALNNLGYTEEKRGNYKSALENYLKSLKIKEEIGDKKGIAMIYNNMAIIWSNQDQTDKAIEYYYQSLKMREELTDKDGIATCLNNLGIEYRKKGDLDKTQKYYNRALKIRKEIGDRRQIAASYNNLAILNFYMNKKDSSLLMFQQALNTYLDLDDSKEIARSYYNISYFYNQEGNTAKAIELAEKSLIYAEKANALPQKRDAYIGLSESFARLNNYKKAYEYHKAYTKTKEELMDENTSREIAEMEAKYEAEKKELEIENLKKEKSLNEILLAKKEAEVKKENTLKIAFGSGFGLMILLAAIIFRSYRQKRRSAEEITKQKTLVEEKNNEVFASINYAKKIQNAILPPVSYFKQYFNDSFILYKPKDIVAGDFYWLEVTGNKICFTAADCTGHGVPGAIMSVLCSNALSKALKELNIHNPAEILNKTAELLEEQFSRSKEDVKDGMDLALCCLDVKNNTLEYAGANNPLYIMTGDRRPLTDSKQEYRSRTSVHQVANNNIYEVKADKQPIGKYDNRKSFTNHTIKLKKGDIIYIFSDGYADQFGGPKGKKLKYKAFRKFLMEFRNEPMEKQKDLLDHAIEEWKGKYEQVDDICVIGVRI